ncbi:MAG: hypothetical protein ACR2PL_00985 [Dehalococcoidia bacterium]
MAFDPSRGHEQAGTRPGLVISTPSSSAITATLSESCSSRYQRVNATLAS